MPSRRASHTASDNQVQLLAFPCGFSEPGGSVPTDRRRGEGDYLAPYNQSLRVDEAREPWLVSHLGEGKLRTKTSVSAAIPSNGKD